MSDFKPFSFFFTIHHNWEWVFKAGMKEIQAILQEEINECTFVERFHELPSLNSNEWSNRSKEKVQYSLFRVDVVHGEKVVAKVRLTSPIFQRLDAKDVFYFKAVKAHSQPDCPYLPTTILIPWDILESKSVEEQRYHLQTLLPTFPSYPAVLKAPMGSGGFGIYFVYHIEDIREVMIHHAERAKKDETVLKRLEAQYECEPIPLSWSLQEFIQPVKCPLGSTGSQQRTQVRAYLIECNDHLFLYSDYEVRCPSWHFDLEEVLREEQRRYGTLEDRSKQKKREIPWEDAVEEECCGDGFARPYNDGRDKKCTFRLMIEEIPELVPSIPSVTNNLLHCFRDLKEYLFKEKEEEMSKKPKLVDNDSNSASLAIIGIDLLVAKTSFQTAEQNRDEYAVKIVEVNNNPAMPGKGKLMSKKYEEHLVGLQKALVGLSLANALPNSVRDQQGTNLNRFINGQLEKFIEI